MGRVSHRQAHWSPEDTGWGGEGWICTLLLDLLESKSSVLAFAQSTVIAKAPLVLTLEVGLEQMIVSLGL